jgi:hypothetical protein
MHMARPCRCSSAARASRLWTTWTTVTRCWWWRPRRQRRRRRRRVQSAPPLRALAALPPPRSPLLTTRRPPSAPRRLLKSSVSARPSYPDAPPAVYFVTPIVGARPSVNVGQPRRPRLPRGAGPGVPPGAGAARAAATAADVAPVPARIRGPIKQGACSALLRRAIDAGTPAGGLARYELAVRRGVAEHASAPAAVLRTQILDAGAQGVARAQPGGGRGGARRGGRGGGRRR